ncbi:hypothetical protein KJ707_00650 [Patescibacteria group bacterium]|nr:hypothetical protein [Patescibacteria group bacterium]MBU1967381.1 hypothetical protein [Patescibacteria group bacterium]MBU2543062.1 hypothetical protein [Patescibacteria group bacterium]
MPKKVIGIFTTNEGHQSMAEAIKASLSLDYKIEIFFNEDPLAKIYLPFYQYFPSLFQVPFKLSSHENSLDAQHKIFRLRYQKKIEDFFQKYRPNLLLNTYFMYNSNLERLQALTQVPFINILADPGTPHPATIANQAKVNITFDQTLEKNCKKIYPNAIYQSMGWFVRPSFQETYNKKQVRKKLGLDLDRLTFLVASGSEGTALIIKVLPILIFSKQPIQVIVACGNNQALYQSTKALQKIINKSNQLNSLIPIQFTPKIHHYMQAADLVIGKAGPNMLFESIATQTPFFAITHISGQEDGNLKIIREYGLGYVEENLLRAQSVLKKIIANPRKLKGFENNVLKLKKSNQQAKEKLQKLVAELI